MDPNQEKRLRRIILLSFYLVLFLIIIIVAFVSYRLGETDRTVRRQGSQIEVNTESIEQLKKQVQQLSTQAMIPGPEGPEGIAGKNGKNSVSTNTVVEKNTIEQIPLKGDSFKFEDFTPDQLASLRGQDARQPIFCKLPSGLIGWRFIDNTICLEIE